MLSFCTYIFLQRHIFSSFVYIYVEWNLGDMVTTFLRKGQTFFFSEIAISEGINICVCFYLHPSPILFIAIDLWL